jgi:hypothetical protein
MTPEHGPRRHFAHQQMSPSFAPPSYTEGPGGQMEKKIERLFKSFKYRLIKIISMNKSS